MLTTKNKSVGLDTFKLNNKNKNINKNKKTKPNKIYDLGVMFKYCHSTKNKKRTEMDPHTNVVSKEKVKREKHQGQYNSQVIQV